MTSKNINKVRSTFWQKNTVAADCCSRLLNKVSFFRLKEKKKEEEAFLNLFDLAEADSSRGNLFRTNKMKTASSSSTSS